MTPAMWKRLATVVALLVLPFAIFAGETREAMVNGQVVAAHRVNHLGVLLAVTGAVLATGMAMRASLSPRPDGPATPGWARTLAAALAALCLGQALLQAGLLGL